MAPFGWKWRLGGFGTRQGTTDLPLETFKTWSMLMRCMMFDDDDDDDDDSGAPPPPFSSSPSESLSK